MRLAADNASRGHCCQRSTLQDMQRFSLFRTTFKAAAEHKRDQALGINVGPSADRAAWTALGVLQRGGKVSGSSSLLPMRTERRSNGATEVDVLSDQHA